MAFARAQEEWLRATLAGMPARAGVGIGSEVPVEGRLLRLVTGPGRAVRVEGDSLLMPGDPAQAGARVGAFLKALARERLARPRTLCGSDRAAGGAGDLRDTRSRWGSCAAGWGLMYSWRLVMAPPAVLDYVAAHEVAHLAGDEPFRPLLGGGGAALSRLAGAAEMAACEGQALHAFRFGD
jgi:predicted metal-dependent hydrolase